MQNIVYLLWGVMVIIIFIINYKLLKNKKTSKTKDKINFLDDEKNDKYHSINKKLKKSDGGYFSYDRINAYLIKNGSPYDLNVAEYIIVKCLLTLIVGGICILVGQYFLAALLSILGFFAIDLLIYSSNKKDMEEIKFELADVYDVINIQTSAGVFIGDVLTDTYLAVKNRRFKKALMELAAEINLTKHIDQALDNFATKFSSMEIDAFVMTMKQGILTGKTEDMLDDISDSLKDMNMIQVDNDTDKIKRKSLTIEVLMYIGILAVIIYGMYSEIMKGLTTF